MDNRKKMVTIVSVLAVSLIISIVAMVIVLVNAANQTATSTVNIK